MSSLAVKDGTGEGYSARVDSGHNLHTFSRVISEKKQATEDGESYNINTGIITLTNAVDTPLLYLKNNESKDFHIDLIVFYMGTSTGGTATLGAQYTVIRNPTTGTIITSTPTDAPMESNANFGSNNTVTIDAYIGATGDTMTDGSDHAVIKNSLLSRIEAPLDVVLTNGASIGVKVKPPTSNTSVETYCAILGHFKNSDHI
tara:strand:- start:1 stop:606 length:606 start_codon:yes stop_codon:yes gene_type:complete